MRARVKKLRLPFPNSIPDELKTGLTYLHCIFFAFVRCCNGHFGTVSAYKQRLTNYYKHHTKWIDTVIFLVIVVILFLHFAHKTIAFTSPTECYNITKVYVLFKHWFMFNTCKNADCGYCLIVYACCVARCCWLLVRLFSTHSRGVFISVMFVIFQYFIYINWTRICFHIHQII